MTKLIRMLGLAILLSAFLVVWVCYAAKMSNDKTQQNLKITTNQANTIVLKDFPGQIQGKADLENEEGKWEYRVMVKSDKTLWEVMVNASSGKIEKVENTTISKEEEHSYKDKDKDNDDDNDKDGEEND
ncbi:MAG: PepSY domain-containing protein [Firmicutes bacterium]|nr:PepSY domain-containing protein [Bacillota bacterium]